MDQVPDADEKSRYKLNLFSTIAFYLCILLYNMQNIANKYIRVSDIASYYFCPRLTYFNLRKSHDIGNRKIRAEVLKSLSSYFSEAISSTTPEIILETAIDRCCEDTMVIYGSQAGPFLEVTRSEVKSRMSDMLSGLRMEKQRIGEQRLANYLATSSISEAIYSDRLRISGTIDRIVRIDGELMPVVISGSMPPPNGIYMREHVKLAAYSLLLAEKYQEPVSHGAVEYVLSWQLREMVVRSDHKRKALSARNRILEMLQGKMPDARKGSWCEHCEHNGSCNIRVSFLDSLFKK